MNTISAGDNGFHLICLGQVSRTLDARDTGASCDLRHEVVQVITEPVTHHPCVRLLVGKRASTKMDRFGPLGFQDFRFFDQIVARTLAGKKSCDLGRVITGEALGAPFQTGQTSGQWAAVLIFFATNQSDFGHPCLPS
ncbi:hypothetical protein DESC_700133 [Desulfosarcina cetonica]|nr:hypothetical protein DESC_700133 [Desulfosarcina cetonica]